MGSTKRITTRDSARARGTSPGTSSLASAGLIAVFRCPLRERYLFGD
jgi:hypothetical protein